VNLLRPNRSHSSDRETPSGLSSGSGCILPPPLLTRIVVYFFNAVSRSRLSRGADFQAGGVGDRSAVRNAGTGGAVGRRPASATQTSTYRTSFFWGTFAPRPLRSVALSGGSDDRCVGRFACQNQRLAAITASPTTPRCTQRATPDFLGIRWWPMEIDGCAAVLPQASTELCRQRPRTSRQDTPELRELLRSQDTSGPCAVACPQSM